MMRSALEPSPQKDRAMNRLTFHVAAAVAAFGFVLTAAGAGSAATPVPAAVVTSVTAAGAPFGAAPHDLKAYGYVEQEYYVEGLANRYRFTGPQTDAEVIDGGHKYKTRILVRRPADPKTFNGTVAVEWYNVTTGQDIDFDYAAAHEYLLRNGYAIVAVSAQIVGVDTLKKWNPARYGDLTLAAPPTEVAPPNSRFGVADVLGWDVFSQTVQTLRHPGAVDALAGLKVKRVIADGESQSAGMLTRYYNGIDPLHRVIDGVVFYDGAGSLRTDSPTKAITVGTEVFGAEPGSPQPDSAVFRRWEVAGASHIGLYESQYADAITVRDGVLKGPDGKAAPLSAGISGCAWSPIWSAVPVHYVVSSAFAHMNSWIQDGAAPPSAPRFERDASVTPAVTRMGADGLVAGGIRLSEVEYPTGINRGRGNTGANFFCFLTGAHKPFTAEELVARYPDPAAYVRDVQALNARNAAAGFILPTDARASTAKAQQTIGAKTNRP
jgi:hypothetical protein